VKRETNKEKMQGRKREGGFEWWEETQRGEGRGETARREERGREKIRRKETQSRRRGGTRAAGENSNRNGTVYGRPGGRAQQAAGARGRNTRSERNCRESGLEGVCASENRMRV